MTTQLPSSITTYVQATNARDTDLLLTTLTDDALVIDEGHEYHGKGEIREWRHETYKKYQYTVEVIDATQLAHEMVVTILVAGNFAGSPVQLHYHFTLNGDRIAALRVQG
jgi:ketosteroid isomerase-like protein